MTVGKGYQDTSKPQKRSTCNDSHAKCFITTNSTAKLSPGAVNRGEIESVFPMRVSVIFPLCFHLKFYTYSTELSLQNTLFNM